MQEEPASTAGGPRIQPGHEPHPRARPSAGRSGDGGASAATPAARGRVVSGDQSLLPPRCGEVEWTPARAPPLATGSAGPSTGWPPSETSVRRAGPRRAHRGLEAAATLGVRVTLTGSDRGRDRGPARGETPAEWQTLDDLAGRGRRTSERGLEAIPPLLRAERSTAGPLDGVLARDRRSGHFRMCCGPLA